MKGVMAEQVKQEHAEQAEKSPDQRSSPEMRQGRKSASK